MTQVKLTEKQKRFADEYLVDLNATAAYGRAGYAAKGNAAEAAASRLLSNVKVREYIQQRMQQREQRTEITQDMVLQHWWDIATANPNDLIYHRRVCCRHCFGVNHAYQWRDDAEYERAVAAEIRQAAIDDRPSNEVSDAGGYGFDPTIRPHPKCPKCFGEGHGDIQATDTRDLGPQARLLYAGVKATKDGIEIKMRDQDKAMELVARHLGMFDDSLRLKGDTDQPLQVVFNIPRPPKP